MCLDRSESWKRGRSRFASPFLHVCCSPAMTCLTLQRCFATAQLSLCLRYVWQSLSMPAESDILHLDL